MKTTITDSLTGITITGYLGQTKEQLQQELNHRVKQLSVVTLVRSK